MVKQIPLLIIFGIQMARIGNHPLGSALYSRVIPDAGGDTVWVDMEAAYDALSLTMKTFLEGLNAIHDVTGGYGATLLKTGKVKLKEVQKKLPRVTHPIVTVHPASKRKSLFVSSSYTTSICDMSKHESDCLLNLLFQHLLTPEFQMRHHWEKNTMIVWDNRTTTHYAVADYGKAYRKMHRVSILS